MGAMIGIDLGTTNSCMATMEGGKPVVIPNGDGERTTPSVVAFTKQGDVLVGTPAKRQAAVNPEGTFSSVKRSMGSTRKARAHGKLYRPQEISAFILKKLKEDAERYLGQPVTDAVITVPAYFTDAQRQATKDAGTIAGLNVQRIINEPTAAALAYGVDREEDQAVMVFDLGGGTFDVSVLSISAGYIEVLATAGDNRLGGDDFDERLANWVADEFKRTHGIDLMRDPMAAQRVLEASEMAKRELSSLSSTTINLPYICAGKDGPLHLEQVVTRETFEQLTSPLVERTLAPCKQALADAGIAPAQVGKVIMVGGSSRIPAVQEAVRKLTGRAPDHSVNPDESVAMGACLQAGVLSGSVNSLILLDVTPHSLGVEVIGDKMSVMIPRNSSIPTRHTEIYTTAQAVQPMVQIHVLQGESPQASKNRSLGKFMLGGLRPGHPQIEVVFELDIDGIVHVSARDLSTGKAAQISITGSSNMSLPEIQKSKRLLEGK